MCWFYGVFFLSVFSSVVVQTLSRTFLRSLMLLFGSELRTQGAAAAGNTSAKSLINKTHYLLKCTLANVHTHTLTLSNEPLCLLHRPHQGRTCVTSPKSWKINSDRRSTLPNTHVWVTCRCRPCWRETTWRREYLCQQEGVYSSSQIHLYSFL